MDQPLSMVKEILMKPKYKNLISNIVSQFSKKQDNWFLKK